MPTLTSSLRKFGWLRTAGAALTAAFVYGEGVVISFAHDHGKSTSGAPSEIKIVFIPPPMAGTLSLGIYDAEGQLVRVLHQEADTDEFQKAFNGLVTSWDGRDDEGRYCAPGEYRAKGFMVGDLGVEGVDFHGNDWFLDDDSPRITRIVRISGQQNGEVLIEALQPGRPQPALFLAKAPGGKIEEPGDEPAGGWKLRPAPEGLTFPGEERFSSEEARLLFTELPGVVSMVDATSGPNNTVWGIDGKVIKEYVGGELDRTLYPVDETLTPVRISGTADLLFVVGESPEEQRLRGLPFESPGEAWVEMGIVFHDTIEQALPLLRLPGGAPFEAEEEVKVRLIANPLLHDAADRVKLRVDTTPSGTLLSTADGLPLTLISETQHLRWAAIGEPSRRHGLTLFESDGAVIAEFRIANPGQMMAFDAGNYAWQGAKEKAQTPAEDESGEAKETEQTEQTNEDDEGAPIERATPESPESGPSTAAAAPTPVAPASFPASLPNPDAVTP